MFFDPARIKKVQDRLSEDFGADVEKDAKRWHEAISKKFDLISRPDRQVVFIGEVGVGKSSAVATTANLLVEDSTPADKSSLRKLSMLPTGAGRTTLCEIVTRAHLTAENSGEFGIILDSFSEEDMSEMTQLWAEDEWNKRKLSAQNGTELEAPSNSQEVARALRTMAGYAERSETVREGGTNAAKRRIIHPLDDVIESYDDFEKFKTHLLERLNLEKRGKGNWWFPPSRARSEIKELLEKINAGSCREALLPKKITLVIPDFMQEIGVDKGHLQFVDSRGLDAGVRLSARPDLQRYVADPHAIYVLCSPFKSAPGDAVREFLKEINEDARWLESRNRIIVALLDQGDAEQVNGAGGDREAGLEIKLDECISELRNTGIIASDFHIPMLAVDVLLDSPAKLRRKIKEQIDFVDKEHARELEGLLKHADQFLDNLHEGARTELIPRINKILKDVLRESLPSGVPMASPVQGALNAIQVTQHASVIYAACRRRGKYRNLDLYEAIASAAATAATAWITKPIRRVVGKLNELIDNEEYRLVRDDLHLYKLRFNESKLNFVQSYSDSVKAEVAPLLQKDKQLWNECCSNWGMSNGFKSRVHDAVREWSEKNVFTAHLQLHGKTEDIPFWSVLVASQSAPRFTVHAKNLRALRNAEFSPEPVSLLIGANGAGKSTLLHVLRVLRLGYERGFIEAIKLVFGGTYDLKNWASTPEDAIQLGLKVGGIEWIVEISLLSSGNEIAYREKLSQQNRPVFDRDSTKSFQYNGVNVIVGSDLTALRVLSDRGEIHPAIQKISDLLLRIGVYEDPDLASVRQQGSSAFDDSALQGRGQNVLAVLRRWQQDAQSKKRFDFVMQGLQAAFPSLNNIDFVSAGNTLAARTYRQGREQPAPLSNEANGFLQLLILLADVAQSDPGGIVAIDEPENGLHPYAIRMFLLSCQQWALKHRVTLLLSTHSLVLLDQFTDNPDAVFVMKEVQDSEIESVPNALTDLCNREWLLGFKLGDLYEQGEIGSNDDEK